MLFAVSVAQLLSNLTIAISSVQEREVAVADRELGDGLEAASVKDEQDEGGSAPALPRAPSSTSPGGVGLQNETPGVVLNGTESAPAVERAPRAAKVAGQRAQTELERFLHQLMERLADRITEHHRLVVQLLLVCRPASSLQQLDLHACMQEGSQSWQSVSCITQRSFFACGHQFERFHARG